MPYFKGDLRRIKKVSPQELPILLFLWKWKTATTALLHYVFYPHSKTHGTYQRLRRLEAKKLVRVQVNTRGELPVWTLENGGFVAIKDLLPPLCVESFKSECPVHDVFACALHLGFSRKEFDGHVGHVTEQELTCIDPEFLPTWVPKDSRHIPDGLSAIHDGLKFQLIAYEAELTIKSKKRYDSVARYYDHYRSIECVLWLVESMKAVKHIVKAFEECRTQRILIHNFLLKQDFESRGWLAQIVQGNYAGKSVLEIHSKLLKDSLVNYPINVLENSIQNAFLDFRKSYKISKP